METQKIHLCGRAVRTEPLNELLIGSHWPAICEATVREVVCECATRHHGKRAVERTSYFKHTPCSLVRVQAHYDTAVTRHLRPKQAVLFSCICQIGRRASATLLQRA